MRDQALSVFILAYGLDLLLGDPRWMPHPVRWIGRAIDQGERWLRRWITGEYMAGGVLVVMIVGGSFGLSQALLRYCFSLSSSLGLAVSTFLLFTCISTRDLDVESRAVFKALEQKDIALARIKVSLIVGRDTQHLTETEITRATVECVAENTVDGIISPLFFAFLGGVPLAVAYRAVNTLDAMIGHRTERYIKFGRVAATVDNWANLIPARLSGILFPLAAGLTGFSFKGSWKIAWKDGFHAAHPNSAVPEAAMAGALGVQLGGMNSYKGMPVPTPLLGERVRALEPRCIKEATRIMYACSLITFFIVVALKVILMRFVP
jgi:adenosylcobinamide-phosphate synthase